MKTSCRIMKMYRWVVKLAAHLQVPSDKLLHFICAMILMAVCTLLLGKGWALIVTSVICVAKEVYDCVKKSPTGWSWGDLLADLLGILIII